MSRPHRIVFTNNRFKVGKILSKLKKYLASGLLMTVVSSLLRTLAVSFNVYVSNKIGAEALGLYTLLGSVYSFALTLATSGINLTTTRMVSDALGEKDTTKVRRSMTRCILYSLSFGLLASVLLFTLAEPLGTVALKDVRTVRSLRLLSVTLPLISVSSCLNGYFTSVRRVYKNASVQIFEQLFHIFACIVLLEMLIGDDMESSCVALVLGGALAEMLSFSVSLILYVADKKKHLKKGRYSPPSAQITKKMLSIALPLALSAYFRSALLTIEHILIPVGIEKSGAKRSESLIAYGTLQSMVLPVVLLPASLIYSFSGLLIPELAELKIQKNYTEIKYIASRVVHLALIFSIGVCGVMIFCSEELGAVLYSSEDAGRYIRLLAPVIPIMYLDSTVDAMLKGLGEQLYSMKVNIIDSLCSVFLVWFLIPRMGIDGYIAMIIISEIFNATLSVIRLLSISKMKLQAAKWIVKPIFSIVASAYLSNLIFKVVHVGQNAKIALLIHIVTVAVLYLLLVCIFGALDKEDISWIVGFFKRKEEKRKFSSFLTKSKLKVDKDFLM